MKEEIKVGDLVIQISSCCGAGIGRIFKVERIASGLFKCAPKGCNREASFSAIGVADEKSAAPIMWLKKINPLSDELKCETKEELTA